MGFQIAIDGPAGAGKSTIAKRVAKQLGFIYVDTGAMYRAAALYFLEQKTDLYSEEAVRIAASGLDISLKNEDGAQKVFLNGSDVTGKIRSQEIGAAASVVSAYPCVREGLTVLQRGIADEQPVVMDGRDIGTTVLPAAPLKIYLTASPECRARRRLEQLKESGDCTRTLDEIREEIEQRDEQDKTRALSPLRRADDAFLIDSSKLDIDAVTDRIIRLYREACREMD